MIAGIADPATVRLISTAYIVEPALAPLCDSLPMPQNRRAAKDTCHDSRGKAQDSLLSPGLSSPGFCSRLMRW